MLTWYQVLETVKALEHDGDRVTRFSATGFSLGGLIARYCITYAPNVFFSYILPVTVITSVLQCTEPERVLRDRRTCKLYRYCHASLWTSPL